MEVSGLIYDPVSIPWGKSPGYAFDRKVGGPQSRFGRSGEEKKTSLPLPGIEF